MSETEGGTHGEGKMDSGQEDGEVKEQGRVYVFCDILRQFGTETGQHQGELKAPEQTDCYTE